MSQIVTHQRCKLLAMTGTIVHCLFDLVDLYIVSGHGFQLCAKFEQPCEFQSFIDIWNGCVLKVPIVPCGFVHGQMHKKNVAFFMVTRLSMVTRHSHIYRFCLDKALALSINNKHNNKQ